MRLARPLKKPPLEIARAIAERVPVRDVIAAVDVAPPGFINVRLDHGWLARQVEVIASAGDQFGRTDTLKGQKIQVEFISANPTGPMTIANARGGPIGDVLANVLAFHGAVVTREFYLNDGGGRVAVLGESVAVRYRELGGDTSVPFPEDGYPADYIIDVAKRIRAEDGDRYEPLPLAEQAAIFTTKAQRLFVEGFKVTTERLGIHFDEWFAGAAWPINQVRAGAPSHPRGAAPGRCHRGPRRRRVAQVEGARRGYRERRRSQQRHADVPGHRHRLSPPRARRARRR